MTIVSNDKNTAKNVAAKSEAASNVAAAGNIDVDAFNRMSAHLENALNNLQILQERMTDMELQLNTTHAVAAKAAQSAARSQMHEQLDSVAVNTEKATEATVQAAAEQAAEATNTVMGKIGGFCKRHWATAAIGGTVVALTGAGIYGVKKYRSGKEEQPLSLDAPAGEATGDASQGSTLQM